MTKLYHRNSPCHPPVVNGVTFVPSVDWPGLFEADVPEEKLAAFEGVPQFFAHPEGEPEVPAVDSLDAPAAAPAAAPKDEGEDEAEDETIAKEGVAEVQAEIDALEAKKATGNMERHEYMKLGKLKKRLAALAAEN